MMQNTAFKPKPDYEPHKTLENDVADYLKQKGFIIHSSTYHDVMNENLSNLISKRFTPTTLYIRARADQMAFHMTKKIDFEWECKTHANRKYNDIAIEMLPLAHHISKSKLDVKCLYCYRNPFENCNYGFWASNIPEIRQINIPKAPQTKDLWNWFEYQANQNFPNVKIYRTEFYNGSGDPYILIDSRQLLKLLDWKILIDNLLMEDL